MRGGSSSLWRRLLPASPLLVLALAVPSSALAEATSNYPSKPPAPATTPATGTSPSKESSKPTTPTTSPPTKATVPTTSVAPAKEAKASTLPFTGFDLRWSVAIGVLLLAAGLSIVMVQRRQRGGRQS